jgi:hypothetical protein
MRPSHHTRRRARRYGDGVVLGVGVVGVGLGLVGVGVADWVATNGRWFSPFPEVQPTSAASAATAIAAEAARLSVFMSGSFRYSTGLPPVTATRAPEM